MARTVLEIRPLRRQRCVRKFKSAIGSARPKRDLREIKSLFFVRGLSSNGKEVFINPDQVLYVRPAGLLRKKTALMMSNRKYLLVDQDIETFSQRFEDYLKDVVEVVDDDDPDDLERIGSGQRFGLT
jgi:hypothetical protein